MGDQLIATDVVDIERTTTRLNAVSSNIQRQTLSSTDSRSTISANQLSTDAFEKAQNGNEVFAEAVSRSVEQINTIATTFGDIDSQRPFMGGADGANIPMKW